MGTEHSKARLSSRKRLRAGSLAFARICLANKRNGTATKTQLEFLERHRDKIASGLAPSGNRQRPYPQPHRVWNPPKNLSEGMPVEGAPAGSAPAQRRISNGPSA
jgi:hypothetical protein